VRILTRLAVGATAVVSLLALTALPGSADPPAGTVPRATDIVGVGSDTIEYVMDQFSHDYNATHSGVKLYSYDATNPATGAIHDIIKPKAGCIPQARPDGSGEGINAISGNTDGSVSGHPCEDFARSSSDRKSSQAPYAPGGIAYIVLAGDAVTYATQAVTNAPNSLTTAQLTAIYSCSVTNWKQVGGKNAPIKPFLPQTSSGTRSFFLSAIGVTTPGACVSDGNNLLEENEGTNPLLHSPDAIIPYSVGKYLAEVDHSASCLNSGCTAVHGVACKPHSGQNLFGCNTHGSMVLHNLNGTSPLSGKTINNKFSATFVRHLFEVVRYDAATADHIPPSMEPVFGAKGWVCQSPVAKQDLLNYGFILLGGCGTTH
jgi:ABC-type phosphate transport system substrate-binding protein